jgi:hypothetical protein
MRQAIVPQAIGGVVEDRLWEWIGALEHHPDTPAQRHHVHVGVIDILSVQAHRALNPDVRYQVVHPVDRAQQRRFATARRADNRCDMPLGNRHRDLFDRHKLPIGEREGLDPHFHGRREGGALVHCDTDARVAGRKPALPAYSVFRCWIHCFRLVCFRSRGTWYNAPAFLIER